MLEPSEEKKYNRLGVLSPRPFLPLSLKCLAAFRDHSRFTASASHYAGEQRILLQNLDPSQREFDDPSVELFLLQKLCGMLM